MRHSREDRNPSKTDLAGAAQMPIIHKIPKSKFKAKALELFEKIEKSGHRVIVTNRGKPCIEMRAFRHLDQDPLEALRGSVLSYENPTDPIF
jgi:antitoxin (DNA-binding transcriptional repressor) of toxin-antitoxin stability system